MTTDYNGKLIGFVVKTRRDQFKPLIGRVINSDDDDDSIVHVEAEQPPQASLEAALACFTPEDDVAVVLQQPVPPRGDMGHWLNPMLAAQHPNSVADRTVLVDDQFRRGLSWGAQIALEAHDPTKSSDWNTACRYISRLLSEASVDGVFRPGPRYRWSIIRR